MMTASIVSRARAGLASPVSMIAAISATSIVITASVRISVP